MECPEEGLDEGSKGINEQASYAANKLSQLYDKLEYKRQALGSIQNAPKPDKKVQYATTSVTAMAETAYCVIFRSWSHISFRDSGSS